MKPTKLSTTAPEKQVVAVFDFDGTITDRHTFWRYLRFISTPLVFWPSALQLIPSIVGVLVGRTTLMTTREVFIRRFLGNMTQEVEAQYAARFIAGPLKQWIRPAALRRLRWHQAQGHRTVLVSNAPENYLIPWGKSVDFDHICGSRLEVSAGRLTGHIAGENCVGAEKVRRLEERVGDLNQFYVYAYGDSEGDDELLSIADSPFYRNWY